jgi:ribosomal protein S18 acetylase RimI-like enzyme
LNRGELLVIDYTTDLEGVEPKHLDGFFVDWPKPPSPDRHLELLRGSSHVVLAKAGDRVVGFITAISDGVLSAYIPLLEVLPEYQRRAIGTELVRRLLAQLGDLYMVDLSCDEDVVPFYERLGLERWDAAMGIRNRDVL